MLNHRQVNNRFIMKSEGTNTSARFSYVQIPLTVPS